MLHWGVIGAGTIARVFCNGMRFSRSGRIAAAASVALTWVLRQPFPVSRSSAPACPARRATACALDVALTDDEVRRLDLSED